MNLAVREISKQFGRIMALKRVSFEVAEGESVGLIGHNGSGKTSLLNLISRLIDTDQGDIFLDGNSIINLSPATLFRRGLARIFQGRTLCNDLTIQDNIELGLYFRQSIRERFYPRSSRGSQSSRSKALMERLELLPIARRFPNQVSAVEQRKAELARALVAEPALILLDEPSAGFSSSERADFSSQVQMLRAEKIGLLITEHDFSMLSNVCDRLVVLARGQIIAVGSPSEVIHSPTVLQAYLGKPCSESVI